MAGANPAPTFVLGNQKSGTSVIAALVAEAAGASVTIDIRGGKRGATWAKLYGGETSFPDFVSENRLDFSRGVVKECNLTYFYRELVEHFPAAKLVFVCRDPRANTRSILNRLSLPGDLPRLGEAQTAGVDPRWSPILKRGFMGLEGENYVEMLALRWSLAANTYLRNAKNMALIRYEDFCKDKAGEVARLARQVGLEQVNDISGMVDRQYQRRGDKSVPWLDFFGPDNLARIDRACGDTMRRLGYVPSREIPENKLKDLRG